MLQLKPLPGKIIVKRSSEPACKSDGLILIEEVPQFKDEGTVVRLGEVDFDLKEGDTVLFGTFAGNKLKIDGEEYLLMFKEDIIGVKL